MTVEKLYRVKDLVELLGWSRQRIVRRFKFHPRTVRDGRRIFVPQSVVEEVVDALRNTSSRRGPKPKWLRTEKAL